MRELRWDIKRGVEIYRSVYDGRLKIWISAGKIKSGEVVVWRSGFSGWRKPEELEELKTFFRRWERHRLRLKRKRVIKRPLFLKRRVRDILIVEDEKDLCELLSDVLRPKRYNVSVANTKKEAMASLKRSPPDLVFLDLKLPDGDGMDLISKIKKTNPKTTINIISAYGSEESKEAAKKKGVYNFIDKPFTEKEILTNVK